MGRSLENDHAFSLHVGKFRENGALMLETDIPQESCGAPRSRDF